MLGRLTRGGAAACGDGHPLGSVVLRRLKVGDPPAEWRGQVGDISALGRQSAPGPDRGPVAGSEPGLISSPIARGSWLPIEEPAIVESASRLACAVVIPFRVGCGRVEVHGLAEIPVERLVAGATAPPSVCRHCTPGSHGDGFPVALRKRVDRVFSRCNPKGRELSKCPCVSILKTQDK